MTPADHKDTFVQSKVIEVRTPEGMNVKNATLGSDDQLDLSKRDKPVD